MRMVTRDRRAILRMMASFGALLATRGVGQEASRQARRNPQEPPSDESLRAVDLGDGLVQVSGAGGNVVVLEGRDGLVLVDSGSAEQAERLGSLIADRFSGAPVSVLFNTHWHLDHTGGNEHLVAPGTTIVAHEHTRLWMTTKFYVEWEDRYYTPRAPTAVPTETFFSSDPQPLELELSGETIVYGQLTEAHTDGDIYVFLPERNVIVAGGAVTIGTYPIPDYVTGGWIGGLYDATEKLLALADSSTRIVPAQGPVLARSDLEQQSRMLSTIRARIEEMALTGKGIDEMIEAQITEEFDARFGNNGALFVSNVYEGLWWNRMRGIVA